MKKQLTKMKFKAVLKIVIPILCMPVIIMILVPVELAAKIVVGVLSVILALIYIFSGIFTLANGSKQAREYIKNYPGGAAVLEEEFGKAERFGGLRVGSLHAFADASDGFYIIPFEKIVNMYIRNEGANPAKGRPGYYYFYIECKDIGGWDEKIKVYYISENNAYDALNYIKTLTILQVTV